jgi:hypothetical protein
MFDDKISQDIAKKERVKHVGLCFLECMKIAYDLKDFKESLGIFQR